MYPHFADLDSRLLILCQVEDANMLTDVVTSDTKNRQMPAVSTQGP